MTSSNLGRYVRVLIALSKDQVKYGKLGALCPVCSKLEISFLKARVLNTCGRQRFCECRHCGLRFTAHGELPSTRKKKKQRR